MHPTEDLHADGGDVWHDQVVVHPEEAGKLPYGVYYPHEEGQKPITPCGQRVHWGNGRVKLLFKCK